MVTNVLTLFLVPVNNGSITDIRLNLSCLSACLFLVFAELFVFPILVDVSKIDSMIIYLSEPLDASSQGCS